MNNTTENNSPARLPVVFAAIDSYVETHIVAPTEKAVSGGDRYRWGDRDLYPGYLLELYDSVSTLRSVIDGCVDYIAGDDVTFDGSPTFSMNRYGETPQDIVRQVARNLKTYGGFALEVIRNPLGQVAEVECIDLRFLRTNKENTVFWYSEKWGKSNPDPVEMCAFMPDIAEKWPKLTDEQKNQHASSILFVKMDQTRVYPAPPYAAAIRACEIERNIDDYHLNNLENGFTSPAVISFNNGVPEQDEQSEITKNFSERFTGHQNAGRPIIAFAPNKENAVTIESLKVEDFGDRYQALAKRSRQEIFTAFRANPNLFGIPTDSLGFSSEEYEAAFKLFNRTQIRPCQRKIADAFGRIYGGARLVIIPFSLAGEGEAAVN